MKKRILVASFALMFAFILVFPAQAAGEVLSTTKDQIKANMPIRFTASGLSGSTYYTLYVGTTLKANRSTSATGTTLEFKIVVGDEFVGQYVTVALKDAAGSATLSSLTIEVVDVVPQYTIDMLGSLFPLIMVFGVVLFAVSGIPNAIVRRIRGI